MFYCYPVYFILLGLAATYVAAGNDELKKPDAELLKLVRGIYGLSFFQTKSLFVLTLLSLFLPQLYLIYPLLTSLLIIHCAFTARLHTQPIVYLRSFPEFAGISVYSRLVYPVARRYGPMVALVHLAAVPGALHPVFEPYKKTRTYGILDEDWKQWVQAALSHCFIVILDIRKPIKGSVWELNQALLTVPHHRIVVINSSDRDPETVVPRDVISFTINHSQDIQDGHARLTQWFKQKISLASG